MPWKEVTQMSQKKEFLRFAQRTESNFSELCRRFQISRKTGYKWLQRYKMAGEAGFLECSRRPHNSPRGTAKAMIDHILSIRDKHTTWGGRKIRRRLENMGIEQLPAPSTITAILLRHGRISPEESEKHTPWQRFEADRPNDLWQMDFKGHFQIAEGRCHPLTILDDHSRYSLCLSACVDEKHATVKKALESVFEKYGLPRRILADNGPPWGYGWEQPYTQLSLWLFRMGIQMSHSRPKHPQTMGKDERFHRTFKAELQTRCINKPLSECRCRFDEWRHVYNWERPHDALGLEVPGKRYKESPRLFPSRLPDLEFNPNDFIRKIGDRGVFSFRRRLYRISNAFEGEYIALRETEVDAIYGVYYYNHKIAEISLEDQRPEERPKTVTYVSEQL